MRVCEIFSLIWFIILLFAPYNFDVEKIIIHNTAVRLIYSFNLI